MAQYIKMLVDGTTTVWQKIENEQVQIVMQQVVSYVDALDQPVMLPDTYEMQVVSGVMLDAPGGV